MATKAKRDPAKGDRRGPIVNAIHAMQRELALEEESYRDLLANVTGGKRSCSDMNYRELGAVADRMRRLGAGKKRRGPKRAGERNLAGGGQAAKMRALWLSLYHLAEVDDPSEAALARFVAKPSVAGVDALEWLGPADADKVIKALRGWCRRIGFQEPMARRVREIDAAREAAGLPKGGHGFASKVTLIELQWQRLKEAGVLERPWHADPGKPVSTFGVTEVELVRPDEADRLIELSGRLLRKQDGALRPSTEDREGGDG